MTAPVAEPAAEAPGAPAEAGPDDAAIAGGSSGGPWPDRVFRAAVVAAVPLLLWVGRDHWFFFDEWWLLARDGLAEPGYLDAHNGHWITVTAAEYRLNFALWGVTTYLPYQVPVVLAHVGTAVLLRALILRTGVRTWIATAVALAFLFFGSGRDNITYGFQISLTGSLLVGLALLLLSDRPGPVARTDWLALGLGAIGLMTSSVFVALVVGVTVVLLLRRGSRVAAFYAVPLFVLYVAWYLRYGGDEQEPMRLTVQTVRFAVRMLGSTFWALAQSGIGGALLAALGAVGVAAAAVGVVQGGRRDRSALVIGPVVAWGMFAALTALARANWPITADQHDAGRYVHVGAALLLPAVALGAEQLALRKALAGVVAVAVLITGTPGNLDRLSTTHPIFLSNPELFGPDSRDVLLAMAHSPLLDDVPADHVPVNGAFEPLPLTTGWMRRNAEAGRIPDPGEVDPEVQLTATNYLVLAREDTTPAAACRPQPGPVRLVLRRGDSIGFEGTIAVVVVDGANRSRPRELHSVEGPSLRALTGPIEVELSGPNGVPPLVCGVDGTA